MTETDTEMRRSSSMPVTPLYLEQKTLKRSVEKEVIYSINDSELYENSDQTTRHSSPAIIADDSEHQKVEPNVLRGLPKHLRSLRDLVVSGVFSIFRKSNTNTTINTEIISEESPEDSVEKTSNTPSNDQTSIEYSSSLHTDNSNEKSNEQTNENASEDAKNVEESNDHEKERVLFSLN